MLQNLNVEVRKNSLELLLKNILQYEDEVVTALFKDFGKPPFESLITETNYVISDLKHTLKKMESWAKPQQVLSSILNFPSSDYIYREPYGKVLIFAPFNYPFQLAMCPLIAAVAAGNNVTLKPSELTPNTAAIISKIIRETFQINHVVAILGDVLISENLLKKRWDYIFFTGSVVVGKIIAKAAAENLTPITLELGGKSPCIVDQTANLELAAKRIIWGKMLNAGQTCIAPDYVLVHSNVKEKFEALMIATLKQYYGENPENSTDFARIVNTKNWERQVALLENQTVIFGGTVNQDTLYIAPTLLNNPKLDSLVMVEEIFGPILPIISYDNEKEVEKIISGFEKPLALYLFSTNLVYIDKVLTKFSFGGGCVNDTMVQYANSRLPFGGVGHSGIGNYHGKFGFDTFSHQKSVIKKANWLDIPVRYPPYINKFNLMKKILKWI